MKKMTTEELKRWNDGSEDFTLIDVLPRDSFDQKHIPGSVSAPRGADDFVERVTQAVTGDKSRTIVVYCASESCDASPKAAEQLEQAGFTDVFDYEGGIDAWESAGHALEPAGSGA